MRKILLFSLLVILIPYIILLLLIRDRETKFIFTSNMMVRVKRVNNNQIDLVPIEEYVIGVVAGEMPVNFKEEALKAQAVASRSYVMYQMVKNKDKEFDVCDTVLNQVYLDSNYLKQIWGSNYEANINKIKDAVLKTAYQYITYDGQLAEALFFSTSSGYTENSEDVFSTSVPYLRSVESPYDSISPAFNYAYDYTYDVFCSLIGIPYTTNLDIKVLDSTKNGRVKKISINNHVFNGSDIASALNLKSSNFNIVLENGKVYIYTKGFGHGVGMSQYGAEGMAELGYTYDEILKHYYTGVNIEKIKK